MNNEFTITLASLGLDQELPSRVVRHYRHRGVLELIGIFDHWNLERVPLGLVAERLRGDACHWARR